MVMKRSISPVRCLLLIIAFTFAGIGHVLAGQPMPVPSMLVPSMEVPIGIKNSSAYQQYQSYLSTQKPKAFASAENGATGYTHGAASIEAAKSGAVTTCEKYASGQSCQVIDANGEPILGKKKVVGYLYSYPEQADFYPGELDQYDDIDSYLNKYRKKQGNKAFAVGEPGSWGWADSRLSIENAKAGALATCRKYNKREKTIPCRIVDVNNEVVGDAKKYSDVAKVSLPPAPHLRKKWKGTIKDSKYLDYIGKRSNKALAISKGKGSAWAYTSGYVSLETAKKKAMANCEKNNKSSVPCVLVMENHRIVNPKPLPTISVGKPWFGHYRVDISNNPKLAPMADMLPSFILNEEKCYVLNGDEVVIESIYHVDGDRLLIEMQGERKEARFLDNYQGFSVAGGDGSVYRK